MMENNEEKFGMSKGLDDNLEKMHKKGYKIMSHPDIMKDMEDMPDDVAEELEKLFKGFKDGTIDPVDVGEPVDLKELEKEDPEFFQELMRRVEESDRGILI